MANWTDDILRFWFSELAPKDWWNKNAEIDQQITDRFLKRWESEKSKSAETFLDSPEQALAATILFDQLPRNMFRDDSKAYSTDPLAQQIASAAVDRGFDQKLNKRKRPFQYMPFMHAEDLALQNLSVALFEKLGSNEKFAASHKDAIKRFGRFPHRNALLGRESSPEELQAVADGASW